MSEMLQSQAVKDAAHTGQGEQLVTNKDGRLVLVFVQGILSPVAEELFHVHGGSVVLIFRYV